MRISTKIPDALFFGRVYRESAQILPIQVGPRRSAPRWAAQCHVLGAIRYGGFKVIVNVAYFVSQGKGMTAKGYVQIVESRLYKPIMDHFKMLNKGKPESKWLKPILVYDSARPHSAQLTRMYLEDIQLPIHDDWPKYSPDLNSIENVWGLAKRKLRKMLVTDPTNTVENQKRVWTLISSWFEGMDKRYTDKLILSFSKRMQACVEKEGYKIRY